MSLLNQLHIFQMAVEMKSFTKVAEHQNLSTSAVSQRITQLERCLNITLFERSTRHLIVTELGQLIYHKSKTDK